jgi:putative membrane-bound dehydrogenase-like protein
MRRMMLNVVGLVVLAVSPAWAEAEAEVEVGVARVDVTPGYPVRLSGYLARKTESRGVAQRIWAKGLAIGRKGAAPVVLVSVDSLGVSRALVDEVAGRLERKVKLPRNSFAVAASHTHSAPCLSDVAPNIFGMKLPEKEQAAVDRYTRELTDAIEKAALAAMDDRKPARIDWSQGRVTFANNRRTKGGPVDHSLPVLRATDQDGKLRAILVNYACHCTTLNPNENTISGDWAGFAQEAIERDHPGALALTIIGCGADANPVRRLEPDAAPGHGRAIADEVKRLLAGPWTPLEPPDAAARRTAETSLPLDTLPTRADLEKLIKAGGAPGYNASVQLARLDRGQPLQSAVDYRVQAWLFGDKLAMVFLPGEVVVDFALRLKREFDPGRLWVTAYANDAPCYIPSERVLREGGYEAGGAMVYYGLPTRFRPGLEQKIVDAVHRVVPDTFRPRPPAETGMPAPLSPQDALQTMRLEPGFRIELVASEPLIESPVALDFGGDGKLWVCEMRDYPTGIDGRWKPGGVIKVLEDRDGDGRYDRAVNFLEGLPFPTGVMAWRKGALICAAPEILYAEDTDGDGKADVRKVLFRGFATENYQARVNGLSYNLDNWVYGANGLIGGTIHGTATGKEINIGGRDFRIRPDTGVMEPATGLTQQGRVHDDWGNQFGNNNSTLIQHYPFPDHYARRNPRVPAPAPIVYLPRDRDSHRIYPSSQTLERFNQPQSANRVTSACGAAIYRDDLLGASFTGNAFTCEPVHNLVHREVLTPRGVTFEGHRDANERESEFLSSTDNWFRPVQVRTGPDGALWVVDMYRAVIEHPRWISPQQLATLDVRAGADKGRIYRVYAEGKPPRSVPVVERLATPELARALESRNGELRDTVQRLLVHRGDGAAVAPLKELAAHARLAESRAQALCTLDGLGALEPDEVIAALADDHPGVRRQAIRLSERWLGKEPAVGEALLRLVADPEVTVRFQLALSLGEWDDPRAGAALGALALRDPGDPWIRAAVLSSSTRQPGPIVAALVSKQAAPQARAAMLGPLVASVRGTRSAAALLESIPRPQAGEPIPAWWFPVAAEILGPGDTPAQANSFLAAVLAAARGVARDERAGANDRQAAIRLLGRDPAQRDADDALLASLLEPVNGPAIQLAAVKALARRREPAAAALLVDAWPHLGPALRAATLDALLARSESTDALLSALETRRVLAGEIDATHRQQLLARAGGAARGRAERLLASVRPQGRTEVLAAYRPALARSGDPARGKLVFGKVCAACHRFDGQGHEVGPDLAALTDTSPEALATAILDPNREVDARYASYTAALVDGRVITGLVAAETANAITLKRQEGVVDSILRADLEAIKTTGQSLMPEGLEHDLKPADLADLVAYVSAHTNRPKALEGNHPQLVSPAADGSLRLAAETAEAYGPTLTYEPATSNLGSWHSAQDRAAWTFRVDRPGAYTVAMEWACADESAGNSFELRVAGRVLRGVVAGTGAGTWSRYRSIFVGEVQLPAGTNRLEFRPAGTLRDALLDLRAVTLTPRVH